MRRQPAGERGRLAQLVEFQIGLHESFLGGVLGQVEVAQQGIGVPGGHVLETLHQFPVGFEVAAAGPVDLDDQFFHIGAPLVECLLPYKPRSGG